MKGINIFNLTALASKITISDSTEGGVYFRMYNASKGNTSSLTVEIIDQMVEIINKDSKDVVKELQAAKAKIVSKARNTKKVA